MTLNDADARAFLIGHLGAEPDSVEALRPGEWSSVYAIRRHSQNLVVRFSEYRDDFEKDRAVARWGTPALPVPPVLEIGEALGLSYAITPRVPGDFLEALDEGRVRAVLPSLLATLDAARSVDLSNTTGFGGWTASGGGVHASWRETILSVGVTIPPERSAGWRERLEASPTGSAPFEEAYALMRKLVEWCPEERHLIHDDLLNRNVLVEGDRISAVLDWGSSMYGDFVYDVALLEYGRAWFTASPGIDFLAEVRRHYAEIGLDVPHLEERVRCYAMKIGLGGMSYNAWKQRWDSVAWHATRTLEFARP